MTDGPLGGVGGHVGAPHEIESPVFLLGGGQSDAQGMTPETVGSKAWNLMRLDRLGLPVPPAFVLGTEFCRAYRRAGNRLPDGLTSVLMAHVRWLENATARSFGGIRRPLLVSVRSTPPVSMPGMLSTILNVGLNNRTVRGLLRLTGNPQLAWDLYRRLIESFTECVHGGGRETFGEALAARLAAADVPTVRELDADALRSLVREDLDLVLEVTDIPFPQDPMEQLTRAVEAVFRSWDSPRAVEYRRLAGLDGECGTAVLVQAMVFGNAGFTSGSGVAFTRNPALGDNDLYVDFRFNAQGEDVVGGRHALTDGVRLGDVLPGVAVELERIRGVLEAEFRDVQDIEFTVEEGRLFLLQTRTGKRTPWAALRVAVDMVREGLIDAGTALTRLRGCDLARLDRSRFAGERMPPPLATGVPAGLGVAVGTVALDAARARSDAHHGQPVILVRGDMSPDDIAGISAADGILTAGGGRTSHAAVVARQLGKTCVVGCATLSVDLGARRVRLGDHELAEGDWLSIDGETGRVYAGRLPVARERPDELLAELDRWREAQDSSRARTSASV